MSWIDSQTRMLENRETIRGLSPYIESYMNASNEDSVTVKDYIISEITGLKDIRKINAIKDHLKLLFERETWNRKMRLLWLMTAINEATNSNKWFEINQNAQHAPFSIPSIWNIDWYQIKADKIESLWDWRYKVTLLWLKSRWGIWALEIWANNRVTLIIEYNDNDNVIDIYNDKERKLTDTVIMNRNETVRTTRLHRDRMWATETTNERNMFIQIPDFRYSDWRWIRWLTLSLNNR